MVVLTFTSSMPILYLAGVMICVIQYWVDKYLFCNYWKNMPLYTKGIVLKAIGILQWGVLIHIGFGVVMITNPKIFKYEATVFDTLTPIFSRNVANFLSGILMIDPGRFNTPHSSLYLLGVIVISGLFVLNKLTALCVPSGTGFFELFIHKVTSCCIKDNA